MQCAVGTCPFREIRATPAFNETTYPMVEFEYVLRSHETTVWELKSFEIYLCETRELSSCRRPWYPGN